jgi:hypothetical protein
MLNKKKDKADDEKRMSGMSSQAKRYYKKKDLQMDSLPGITGKIDNNLDAALETAAKKKYPSPKKKAEPKKAAAKKPAAKKK